MNRHQWVSTAVGALAGAILGSIIEGLNFAVFLADPQRTGTDPFESGDFGYLALRASVAVTIGVIGAVGGVLLSIGDGPETPGNRRLLAYIAGGIAVAAVVGCAVCAVLAASGAAVVPITGSLGAGALSSGLGCILITLCGMAAGVVVGAVRADR
ncbi:hypothetical protein GWI34_08875 [Actinomadura sp. DSM 109109]|nr:hypothetical protein [Actinomadura lepetitiana]